MYLVKKVIEVFFIVNINSVTGFQLHDLRLWIDRLGKDIHDGGL